MPPVAVSSRWTLQERINVIQQISSGQNISAIRHPELVFKYMTMVHELSTRDARFLTDLAGEDPYYRRFVNVTPAAEPGCKCCCHK